MLSPPVICRIKEEIHEMSDISVSLLILSMTMNTLADSSLILNIINSLVLVKDAILPVLVVLDFSLTLSNRYKPPEWRRTASRLTHIITIFNDTLFRRSSINDDQRSASVPVPTLCIIIQMFQVVELFIFSNMLETKTQRIFLNIHFDFDQYKTIFSD